MVGKERKIRGKTSNRNLNLKREEEEEKEEGIEVKVNVKVKEVGRVNVEEDEEGFQLKGRKKGESLRGVGIIEINKGWTCFCLRTFTHKFKPFFLSLESGRGGKNRPNSITSRSVARSHPESSPSFSVQQKRKQFARKELLFTSLNSMAFLSSYKAVREGKQEREREREKIRFP